MLPRRTPPAAALPALSLLCALRPGAARADPTPEGAHAGLMIRAAVGLGYVAARGDDSPLEISGVAFSSHLAVGWYVVPDLAVHATSWSGAAFNPSGTSAAGAPTVSRGNTPSASGRGLGITWVFGATDAFASLSAGVATLSLETAASDVAIPARADPGFGLDVMVGRQFAASSGWRFGLGAQGFFQRNGVTSRRARETVAVGGVALLGTLTYH